MSLTVVCQVLQPVTRGLCLLLQPVAVCPAEQISEGDEAMLTCKHRRPSAQMLQDTLFSEDQQEQADFTER